MGDKYWEECRDCGKGLFWLAERDIHDESFVALCGDCYNKLSLAQEREERRKVWLLKKSISTR